MNDVRIHDTSGGACASARVFVCWYSTIVFVPVNPVEIEQPPRVVHFLVSRNTLEFLGREKKGFNAIIM